MTEAGGGSRAEGPSLGKEKALGPGTEREKEGGREEWLGRHGRGLRHPLAYCPVSRGAKPGLCAVTTAYGDPQVELGSGRSLAGLPPALRPFPLTS